MKIDQEIKEKFLKLWSDHGPKYGIFSIKEFYQDYKTISETKAAMLKDGVDITAITNILKEV